ncbi:hypothetical protein QNK01_09450 [Desemzia incerta]|uniref:hypothetical protein n=1 Tax=Desemzia incerta TaxID=82801 RepID=UPI0024C24B5C|nr:hypothetical protein [Desemzia incerta]WHZ31694.1 hypothetical protein QNK01_09450 [Desemzia incerta]
MKRNINRNIKGNKYKKLINQVSESAVTFSFVTREDIGISDNSIKLIESLTDSLVKSYPTNEWLTNEVIDSPIIGHIYFYKLNSETKNILLEVSNSLFGWGDDALSDLPEDIAFYDKEEKPLLYVNGHENYAVIETLSLKDYLKMTFF